MEDPNNLLLDDGIAAIVASENVQDDQEKISDSVKVTCSMTESSNFSDSDFAAMENESMATVGRRLILLCSRWKTRDDIVDVACRYGLSHGFVVAIQGWSVICNCFGTTKDCPDKERKGIGDDER